MDDGDDDRKGKEDLRAPVAGPLIPPHLLKMSSAAPIGPAMPPHMRADADQRASVDHDASAPKRILGPTMPPRADESGDHLSTGAQAFLDRERRMKEAAERDAAGLPPKAQEASRPDWMIAPPTAQSFSETLQKDQSAALKSRGFSQAGNARVQRGKGGSGLGGTDEDDSSLWTETPQEREQRLREEELGIRSKVSNGHHVETDEERQRRRADREREEKLQQAIREHEAQRGPSLLEQHQSRRRDELKAKKGDHKHGKDEHRKSRRRRSDSESGDSHDARRSHSRRDRKDEDRHRSRRRRQDDYTDTDSYSDRDTKPRREREKGRSDHRDRAKDDRERRNDSHRSHRDRSRERERDERRKEKEKERERKHKRRERELEEKQEKKGASTMIWDREAAMSVGGKLLDHQKRMETIRSAAGLGSRFGSGTARYL